MCKRTPGLEASRLPAPSHIDTLHDQGAQLHAAGSRPDGGTGSTACSMPQVVIDVASLELTTSQKIGHCNTLRRQDKLWTECGWLRLCCSVCTHNRDDFCCDMPAHLPPH